MDKPLISYVVTTYNIEKFVEESVKCAFAQTYSPLEIVLSDDCSTDRTYDIMRQLAEEYTGPHRIVLNRNEENLGITRHMNKVFLEIASGEIIVVAHGDDLSDATRTEEMMDFLIANPSITQVACGAVVVNENGVPYDSYTQRNFHVDELKTYSFGSGAHVSIGFSAFRKSVMEYFGPLDEKCPTEDDPIGFRAIILGQIAFMPNVHITYRKHSGSNSNPELFVKFPLDEIYNQNLRDMEKAKNDGKLSEEVVRTEKERLYKSKEIRKLYRRYFAERKVKHLVTLLKCPYLTNRRRVSYIREHFEYLRGHHE